MAPLPMPGQVSDDWDSLSLEIQGLNGYWISRLKEHEKTLSTEDGSPVKASQFLRVIEDLGTTSATLFQSLVALQRRREDTQRKYLEWYEKYKSERAQICELAAELNRTAAQEREKMKLVEEQLRQAREEESKNKYMLEESRREVQAARQECRRAWTEVSRLEEQNRLLAERQQVQSGVGLGSPFSNSTSTPVRTAQVMGESPSVTTGKSPYRGSYDVRPLPDPMTSLDPYDASVSVDDTGVVVQDEETSSIGDFETDSELQHRLQALEVQYWAQQQVHEAQSRLAESDDAQAGPSTYYQAHAVATTPISQGQTGSSNESSPKLL
ncbi:hypothetical protein V1512DRAFT_200442 [Lipomyces arxii]|uniref:uncharacterized protein n=1 Tax=Lipomyces arxii TaxID=56418 RepID=UPI0034CDAEA4